MIKTRESVKFINPYIPGKPIEELRRELNIEGDIIKLASNENPIGPSRLAVEFISNKLGELNIYPDDGAYHFKKALKKLWDIPEEMIFVGNGSAEIIHYVATAFLDKDDEIILSNPSFIMGKISAQIMEANIVEVKVTDEYKHDLNAILGKITNKTKVIYIDNPNNPLGTYISKDELKIFMDNLPDNILLVLDQAYYEYVEDSEKIFSSDIVKKYNNVLVLHTFSKIYGLAGLRVGYALGNSDIIRDLMRVRMPFNVNSLAQIAAIESLKDKEHIKRSFFTNKENMKYMEKSLSDIGRKFLKSKSNFITIYTPEGGRKVSDALLKKGIIIRPLDTYGIYDWIRVSIGLKREMEIFMQEFKKVIEELKGE